MASILDLEANPQTIDLDTELREAPTGHQHSENCSHGQGNGQSQGGHGHDGHDHKHDRKPQTLMAKRAIVLFTIIMPFNCLILEFFVIKIAKIKFINHFFYSGLQNLFVAILLNIIYHWDMLFLRFLCP